MVSHELRTPLAAITGISYLLDSAAIETGNISIIHHPFNLLQLLDEFRDTYLPQTRARGISYQGIRSNDLRR